MTKIKIGISSGDLNGVGMEVILKTLARTEILKHFVPIIYASSKVVSYHKNVVGIEGFSFNNTKMADRVQTDRINIINCWEENVNIVLGKETEESGKYAYISLDRATQDLVDKKIDALVTAPIHKKSMALANFPYTGHTEFLTKQSGAEDSLMFMISDSLKIGLVTNHLPIRDVAEAVNKSRIMAKVRMMVRSLKVDFGLERPKIAILALNPHASDDGLIGDEENEKIRPAIVEAKKKGMLVMGPYPADGFFGSGLFQKFDGILAMYHDQGLVPFKALTFGNGVNFTAGLSVVRTSPDHGTGYDIAGKNMADPSSFRNALFQAIDIVRNRRNYEEMTKNPLVRNSRKEEGEEGERVEDLVPEEN